MKLYLLLALFLLSVGCKKATPAPPPEAREDAAPSAPVATVPIEKDKGVGPITSLSLAPIDPAKVAIGRKIFETKCSACHKMDERYVGPPLGKIVTQRTPEWIVNMIINPADMLEKNANAQSLIAQFALKMPSQNVTKDEGIAILDFLRHEHAHPTPPKPVVPAAPAPR